MSGVSAARRLHSAGVPSMLIDKGYRPGGRMATKTIGAARYDHGAQHFTARTPEFARLIEPAQRDGVVAEWFHDEDRRLVGNSGMRSIIEHLAEGMEIATRTKVDKLAVAGRSVVAFSDGQEVATGRATIVTAPLPQSLQLIRASGLALDDRAESIVAACGYDPCLTVMGRLKRRSGLRQGHARAPSENIAWIGDNQHKGVSPVPAVTIQSTPEFARRRQDEAPDAWVPALCEEARSILGQEILEPVGHRWLYSLAHPTGAVEALRITETSPIVLAGDAFGGARVEGAFLSGAVAAELILDGNLVG